MAQTYADLEEPLFLDEPPAVPKPAVEDTSDLDELFAWEEDVPQPGNPGRPAGTLAAAPAPARPIRVPVLAGLILAGLALGFVLVLALIG